MRRKGLPTSRRSRAWWVSWLDSECGNQLQLSRDGGSSCIAPLAGDLACSCGAQTVLPKWLPIGGARGKPWDRGSDQAGCSPLGPQEIVGVGGASSPTMCHPPHRSTPFPLEALGPERTMAVFVFTADGRGGRWVRRTYTDRRASGVPQELDGGVLGQWKGFTVFRLECKMMPGETMRQRRRRCRTRTSQIRPWTL